MAKSTRGKRKTVRTGNLFDEILDQVSDDDRTERANAGGQGDSKQMLRRIQAEFRVFPELVDLYKETSKKLSALIVRGSFDPTEEINRELTALCKRFDEEVKTIKREKREEGAS